MTKAINSLSRIVTARPYLTILTLLGITVLLGAGLMYRPPPTEGADLAFLPQDHPVATASQEIEEQFGDSGDVVVSTLIFRGELLTPEGLSQMAELIDTLVSDPAVSGLIVPGSEIYAPSTFIGLALGVDDLRDVPKEAIDAIAQQPLLQPALDAVMGIDEDGTEVAIANISLINTDDERVQEAERRISEIAAADEGTLVVTSLSPTILEDEYKQATGPGVAPQIGLALVLIALLLMLFTRSPADMGLSLLGLIIAIVWVLGAEAWLGPNAAGLIGPPSSLSALVPVIIISLTVDYAIQAVSHYRERRVEGESVAVAVRTGLQHVTVPLVLAAVTTIVSLLATLFSPIGVIGDFGIVAGLGVGMSLIVMLTLLPAGRKIIDQRRESRGTLKPPKLVSSALPGIPRASEWLGERVTRWPAPYIVVVLLITIGLAFAVPNLKSTFSIKDILPGDGQVLKDIETLETAVGGSTEVATIFVQAEATESRTYLNLRDLTIAFNDEALRPQAAAGPIQESYYAYLFDWTHDSGEPGDKYDPELEALFREASFEVEFDTALMQQVLDRLLEKEPALTRIFINNPDGIDTMLLQFPSFLNVPDETALLQEEIEDLWVGDDRAVTAISGSIVGLMVTDQITGRQTESIAITCAVALAILILFFWVTLGQPVLGFVAVAPIVLVLICVLGTMSVLNIPYTLLTSIVTALSIGIGVDYTIHVIHRYREEFSRVRNPEKAAVLTLRTTGSALLGSALTTALGFGALMTSPLAASQQFAITAALTIVYSLVASITVALPAMVVWGAYQNMRLRSMAEHMWDDLDLMIEDVHQQHEETAGS